MKFLVLIAAVAAVSASLHPRDEEPNYLRVDDEEEPQVRLFADEDDKKNFRLNDDTWPSHYEVHIDAFEGDAKTYTGEVFITFRAEKEVSVFELNQQNITLQAAELFEVEGEVPETPEEPENPEEPEGSSTNQEIRKLMNDIKSLEAETNTKNSTDENSNEIREKVRELLRRVASIRVEEPSRKKRAVGDLIPVELEGCVINDPFQKIACTLKDGVLDTEKTYHIHLKYTGAVHTDMRGFYQSSYKAEDNTVRTLGTTHFGQQGRRLLPCWDEPRFKARFQFNVKRNTKLYTSSLTNGKFIDSEPIDETDYVIDHHETTSRIAPYMLALIVSDFTFVRSENERYSVYVRENAKDQALYVFGLIPQLITAFDDWTGLKYYEFEDVKKLDMAAIPDFSAGAMENWGLLIHREVNILHDYAYTNTLQRQRIAHVTSHEMAHQWFGDLVTCDWWDATWLNEGFAAYFEYIGMEPVGKEWRTLDQFVTDSFQNSMYSDASTGAHPLSNKDLYDYADIRTMFTSITYDKGASVLRMMHNLMGANFQKGIQQYLKDHSYATALPGDVITALQAQQPNDLWITRVMTLYTEQAGFPLITVKRNGGKLTMTQSRFFTESKDTTDTKNWTVPITVATDEQEAKNPLSRLEFFEWDKKEFEITIPEDSEYYLLNTHAYNYHRVNYDYDGWMGIKKYLSRDPHIGQHDINRAQIIDDLFQLARAQYLTYDFIFDVIEYIEDEVWLQPWLSFLTGMNYLQTRIPNAQYREEFNTFLQQILEPIYTQLATQPGHSHQDNLLRIRIIDWACKFGVQDCHDFALEQFEKVIAGENIDPNFKPGVYCTGLRMTENNWNTMWQRYVSSNYATEQATILTALGCSKNSTDINMFLSKILTPDIRLQDKSAAYSRAYTGNLENVDIVFDWIAANYVEWGKTMSLTSTLSDLSNRFTNEDQIAKLENFKNTATITPSQKTSLENSIARSKRNLDWDRARIPEIQKFIRRGNTGSAASIYANLALLILSIFAVRAFN